ncbi:hypothetical protein C8Q80DRAFT_81215 [Daedaleopsis nitida]|nr:hypothetical protein C8Q80DRAFT_81215 [Daedaleopsis nitida]
MTFRFFAFTLVMPCSKSRSSSARSRSFPPAPLARRRTPPSISTPSRSASRSGGRPRSSRPRGTRLRLRMRRTSRCRLCCHVSTSVTLGFACTCRSRSSRSYADDRRALLRVANTSEVFYQGFTASGGSRFVACVDCDLSDASGGSQQVVVDAHDQAQDGQQPPVSSSIFTLCSARVSRRPPSAKCSTGLALPQRTLFSFVGLDTNTSHTLTVKNLQDGRFGNTSQLTFDSLIVTQGEPAGMSDHPAPLSL